MPLSLFRSLFAIMHRNEEMVSESVGIGFVEIDASGAGFPWAEFGRDQPKGSWAGFCFTGLVLMVGNHFRLDRQGFIPTTGNRGLHRRVGSDSTAQVCRGGALVGGPSSPGTPPPPLIGWRGRCHTRPKIRNRFLKLGNWARIRYAVRDWRSSCDQQHSLFVTASGSRRSSW